MYWCWKYLNKACHSIFLQTFRKNVGLLLSKLTAYVIIDSVIIWSFILSYCLKSIWKEFYAIFLSQFLLHCLGIFCVTICYSSSAWYILISIVSFIQKLSLKNCNTYNAFDDAMIFTFAFFLTSNCTEEICKDGFVLKM